MRTIRLLSLTVLVPVVASAISIAPGDYFTDIDPNAPEAAGINLLYSEGIVQGIGSGYFAPGRPVNRAEFLKMAILATPSDMRPDVTSRTCFPDVQAADWFSGTVCGAKDAGVVRGNADPNVPEDQWLFAPATTVTYDAALKMLSLLFGYEVREERSDESWGQRYYDAARTRGTDLPVPTTFDAPLSRAMAARLIAGFLAESEGMLVAFRNAENGEYETSESSSSSSESSVSSSASSESSSSSSSEAATQFDFPIQSHFLLVGQTSKPIAGGIVSGFDEETRLVAVQVKLFQEARAVENLQLVLSNGTVLATLLRRTTTDISDYKLTYDAFLTEGQVLTLKQETELPVFLIAKVRAKNNDGFSDNLVHVRQMTLTFRGNTSNETYNIPFTGPFPKHQTTLGRVFNITRISGAETAMTAGQNVTISTFSLESEAIDNQPINLTQLVFSYEKVGAKSQFTNWSLMREDTGVRVACTTNPSEKTISCPNLSSLFGPQGATLSLALIADVQIESGATGEWFQVSLPNAGSPEALGSLWWSDAVGTFRWLEGPSPVVTGTLLTVQ